MKPQTNYELHSTVHELLNNSNSMYANRTVVHLQLFVNTIKNANVIALKNPSVFLMSEVQPSKKAWLLQL